MTKEMGLRKETSICMGNPVGKGHFEGRAVHTSDTSGARGSLRAACRRGCRENAGWSGVLV